MGLKKRKYSTESEYTVSYSDMRGVDFSATSSSSRRRFSHLENMYRDYRGGKGVIESIPGYRRILELGAPIHAIYTHKNARGEEYAVVHSGEYLFRFAVADRDALGELSPIATVRDSESRAFVSGSDLYILDGNTITRVREDGSASAIDENGDTPPYIPTVYYNGEEYEQRNLLTNLFRERYRITVASDLATATEGLEYTVISPEEKLAAVSGIARGIGGEVRIPSYIDIGGDRYKVTRIADRAFILNESVTSVIISDTVTSIGNRAFMGCHALTRVVCGTGVELIENYAFYSGRSLSEIYLGDSVSLIGLGAFENCPYLEVLKYSLSMDEFSKIEILELPSDITVSYNTRYSEVTVEIPIFSPAETVASVSVDGEAHEHSLKIQGGLVTAVILSAARKSELDGREVEIFGRASSSRFTKNTYGNNFLSENAGVISGRAAILGCTVCESFDGRIFISGNPALPNTVFYTSRDITGRNNPLYFGILNYFNDGTGSFCVRSMLAAGESLAVFKAGDDGGGSIYYHTRESTGSDILPTIYPVSYIHSGVAAVGESVSFFDDPIFLSPLGCSALDKKAINLERSIAVRSSLVNSKLLTEDLSRISIAEWCGYLVLAAGEHFYLADSRAAFTGESGSREYEWFYLTGIGTYEEAKRVFVYSDTAKNGYSVHRDKGKKVEKLVYVQYVMNDPPIYHTNEDGVRYAVHPTGEYVGGEFSPVTKIASAEGDLLFFGTESGTLCVFNNDKRGIAPDFIRSQADFDEAEYSRFFRDVIHPSFYSFDSHAPRYALTTVSDDGGIPHFTKSTVKHSLTVKLRSYGIGAVTCEVGTDRSGYKEIAEIPDFALNFSDLDFSSLSFENREFITLPIKEREKGWIEKSVSLYSDEYAAPLGVYSITYRFRIRGKIKH